MSKLEMYEGHKLRYEGNEVKCVNCWEVLDSREGFEDIECESFRPYC